MKYEHSNYLAHHGVKGQRWGVRRYQDESGKYTSYGQHHQIELEKRYRKAGASKEGARYLADDRRRTERRNAVIAGLSVAALIGLNVYASKHGEGFVVEHMDTIKNIPTAKLAAAGITGVGLAYTHFKPKAEADTYNQYEKLSKGAKEFNSENFYNGERVAPDADKYMHDAMYNRAFTRDARAFKKYKSEYKQQGASDKKAEAMAKRRLGRDRKLRNTLGGIGSIGMTAYNIYANTSQRSI